MHHKSLSLSLFECGFEVRAKSSNNFPRRISWYNRTLSKRWGCRDMGLVGSLSLEVRVKKLSWKLDGMWSILGSCRVVSKQNSRVIPKVTLSSECLWVSFHPALHSFTGICKVKTILLNLNIKCWNSSFTESHPAYDQTQGCGAVFVCFSLHG